MAAFVLHNSGIALPQIGMPGPIYSAYSKDNKGIEGGFSNTATISTTEEAYFDEVVWGSDTDEYTKWVGGVNQGQVYRGHVTDVSISPTSLDGDVQSGSIFGSPATSELLDDKITLTFTRKATNFGGTYSYPVTCIDRYKISDNTDPSTENINRALYDPNVVNLAKNVLVYQKP